MHTNIILMGGSGQRDEPIIWKLKMGGNEHCQKTMLIRGIRMMHPRKQEQVMEQDEEHVHIQTCSACIKP